MKKKKIIKNILLVLLLLVFVGSVSYIGFKKYDEYRTKKENEELREEEPETQEPETPEVQEPVKTKMEKKVEKLHNETNKDIFAWIKIEGTNINYPVLQGKDNDYYLNHNYKKKYSEFGSIYLDKSFDLVNGSTNYLLYGHRSQNGMMFEDLIKYKDKSFYKKHKIINFTTLHGEEKYEIIAVFYSRLYYVNEKNVFRYYFFVDAKNEKEFNDFVNNAKKASIYDTGVTAKYGDQLMTLSTCEYSQEDGRFAVVARKVTE